MFQGWLNDGVRVKRKVERWKEGRSGLFLIREDLQGNMRHTNKCSRTLQTTVYQIQTAVLLDVFLSFSPVLYRLDCLTVFALAKKRFIARFHQSFKTIRITIKQFEQCETSLWSFLKKTSEYFLTTKSEKQEACVRVFNYIQREKFLSVKERWDFSNA